MMHVDMTAAMQRQLGRLEAHREAKEQAWAGGQVDTFPESWAGRLLARWREQRRGNQAGANLELLRRSQAIARAHRVGVPADANDDQLRQEATDMARDTARRVDLAARTMAAELADREPAQRDRLLMLGMLLEAWHWMERRGVAERLLRAAARYIPGALARVRCERFWRGVLRGIHARAVESTARAIGLVNKRAGCYVSDDSLRRRQGQRLRNERALESVVAVNEHQQEYTLAELAARGPANRAIRRMELMTRIAGFELIAKELGHLAYFVTVTCPSRMHAWRTVPGTTNAVTENKHHDGTQVDQAQRYLCTQWRRFSAAAERAGLELYGFRIAEPNHDGTPHWHVLLFFPERAEKPWRGGETRHAGRVAVRLLRRYFLWQSDPAERGARRHRVTVERIDWSRGSAAGYVAKYVSKNIDGYRVEQDLYGNDTLTSSQRVDAWASTWRIRQFQQIGGAPVGVWRELRRLHPEQAQASAGVALALDAVNVASRADQAEDEAHDLEEGRQTAAHGWATYLHLQGGHRVKRRALRLQLLREQSGELGRYGELMPPRPVGVATVEVRAEEVPGFGIVRGFQRRRTVRAEVESERASWIVVPKGFVAQARRRLQAGGEAARPWSPVNNCTPPDRLFAGPVERIKKRGRWHRWKMEPGGSTSKETHHAHPPNHRG